MEKKIQRKDQWKLKKNASDIEKEVNRRRIEPSQWLPEKELIIKNRCGQDILQLE